MKLESASGAAGTRCNYCGAGLRKAVTRRIGVNGQTVGVHMRHPRRAGEVSA
ncbi:hypothetical protein PUR71_30205 [Streptomyces sp. SP17BM10]|uniref:hypothetical protein n=1 Tax=Streptomyces sp. SP17BM10 TaxID=3002530 RepID=UPI002E7A9C35|nr:hypothetical protein [Streptomyces sp. SP17BM10]MEE1787147.1 hypothetical protein [Streptomyces sp. SP17BM10]